MQFALSQFYIFEVFKYWNATGLLIPKQKLVFHEQVFILNDNLVCIYLLTALLYQYYFKNTFKSNKLGDTSNQCIGIQFYIVTTIIVEIIQV